MGVESNYYARLGIPVNATPEELRRAYREAARQLHPDTNVEAGETELFLSVQEAYDVISDPEKRTAYDATLPPEVFAPPPVKVSTLYSRGKISARERTSTSLYSGRTKSFIRGRTFLKRAHKPLPDPGLLDVHAG